MTCASLSNDRVYARHLRAAGQGLNVNMVPTFRVTIKFNQTILIIGGANIMARRNSRCWLKKRYNTT